MNKIILLPPEISQKIAAGEVIERPFSVVKELVENSLDAGAREVKVELGGGGKSLIRVVDDGQGMSREDAVVCFERHSTSKISSEEDLAQIMTLGFRGEALPSISAVSRVTLKTYGGKGNRGTIIEREGEKTLQVSDTAFPEGTSVEVKDLFFNLPARQKFLHSDRAELGMIVKYLSLVVLAFPEVRFSLIHGKRATFNYPPVKTLRERLFQIYGKSVLEQLMEVDYREIFHLYGYASRPPHGRSDRRRQLFFVNRRPVRDKILQAALNQAYRGVLEKDLFAEAFLFLYPPYSEVDVNVHPAKAEVRFKNSQLVYQQILRGIQKEIGEERGIKEVYPSSEQMNERTRLQESRAPVFKTPKEESLTGEELFKPSLKDEAHPRTLAQYLYTYILASNEEGLFIIDQHNAHERILYEQYQEIDAQKKWPVKISLLPVLFDLSPSQELTLESNQALLKELGFRVEAMGGKSYALKEFPDIFDSEEAKDSFFSLLDEIKDEKIENKRIKLLATLACKTAIKAGEALSSEKMNYLVEELFKTSNFSLCPHGRPIMIKVGRKEIEKGLKRPRN
ncbi:MAG: DNA mismatch repair endonuclease MutL [Candidatus Aminicenantes bacterium]|nr:DNA mismatch repair endonuclease MutL [Candidatus Aminicenantes bacterium]